MGYLESLKEHWEGLDLEVEKVEVEKKVVVEGLEMVVEKMGKGFEFHKLKNILMKPLVLTTLN